MQVEQKRKVGKKERKTKEANKGRGKRDRMALEECCINERKRTEGQNPIQRWIARRLSMKKKRKAGKKATKWQNNGKRSNIWKKYLKEEEWKETP